MQPRCGPPLPLGPPCVLFLIAILAHARMHVFPPLQQQRSVVHKLLYSTLLVAIFRGGVRFLGSVPLSLRPCSMHRAYKSALSCCHAKADFLARRGACRRPHFVAFPAALLWACSFVPRVGAFSSSERDVPLVLCVVCPPGVYVISLLGSRGPRTSVNGPSTRVHCCFEPSCLETVTTPMTPRPAALNPVTTDAHPQDRGPVHLGRACPRPWVSFAWRRVRQIVATVLPPTLTRPCQRTRTLQVKQQRLNAAWRRL